MVTVYDRFPVHPCASVAVTVKLKFPTVVGVPDKSPAKERVSPPGNVPDVVVKEYGAVPPLALSV